MLHLIWLSSHCSKFDEFCDTVPLIHIQIKVTLFPKLMQRVSHLAESVVISGFR